MAAAEHATTACDESMELPSLPPNQGVEAMKDIVFGSVSVDWTGLLDYGCDMLTRPPGN